MAESPRRQKAAWRDRAGGVHGDRMHLKSVSRSFRRAQMRDHGLTETPRPVVYGTCVTAFLRTVWEAGGEPCGENLHPLIAEIVMILRRDGDWEHPESATRGLLRMSEGTVKARVSAFERTRWSCRGKARPNPAVSLAWCLYAPMAGKTLPPVPCR